MIKALIVTAAVLAGLWSVYWAIGSQIYLSRIEASLKELDADQNLSVAYSELELKGFPNRFDLAILNPSIRRESPVTAWHAPFIQLLSLSYRPLQVIVAWPNEQFLTIGSDELRIASEGMRASIAIDSLSGGEIRDLIIEAGNLDVQGPAGRLGSAADALLALSHTGEGTYRFGASFHSAKLDTNDDPAAGLNPVRASDLTTDMELHFGEDLNLEGLADGKAPRQLSAIRINRLSVRIADSDLEVQGQLHITKSGFFEGQTSIRMGSWDNLAEAAVRLGWLPPELLPLANSVVQRIASPGVDQGELVLTPEFRNGRTYVNGIELLPAPRIDRGP